MDANEWILSHDTGTSSKVIWGVMMGVMVGDEHPFDTDVPHDPDDFGRCYRLLQYIPGWRSRLGEVAKIFPKWGPMVREWDKLTLMYLDNLRKGKEHSDEMYQFMSTLEKEGMVADGWIKTGSCTWEKKPKVEP